MASRKKTPPVKVPLPIKGCCSFRPGHGTHYLAPLRVYVDTPRDPITVLDADADGWVTFRDEDSREIRWWHHDARRLVALWHGGAPFSRVRDSTFLVAQDTRNAHHWLSCSQTPSACVRQPSTDPLEALKREGGFVMTVKGLETDPPDGEN